MIQRERPRPVSLGLRPIHLQGTLTVHLRTKRRRKRRLCSESPCGAAFHTILPSESFDKRFYRQSLGRAVNIALHVSLCLLAPEQAHAVPRRLGQTGQGLEQHEAVGAVQRPEAAQASRRGL